MPRNTVIRACTFNAGLTGWIVSDGSIRTLLALRWAYRERTSRTRVIEQLPTVAEAEVVLAAPDTTTWTGETGGDDNDGPDRAVNPRWSAWAATISISRQEHTSAAAAKGARTAHPVRQGHTFRSRCCGDQLNPPRTPRSRSRKPACHKRLQHPSTASATPTTMP